MPKLNRIFRKEGPYGDVQRIPAHVKYWDENRTRMNFCVVHRVVLSKRTLLAYCCCILYSFDNRGRGLELNFYPKISVLVNMQYPENSFSDMLQKAIEAPSINL